ncbi:MAG: heparinase II/III domain-containing protein [Thermomicrobiales bacterium]
MTLIAAEWIEALRHRARHPNFAAARQALAEQIAPYRGDLPPHPNRQAGYYHDFFCPAHAVQLRFDPHEPHRHVCPVDEAVFTGEPFDSAWRWSLNDLLSDAALKLAVNAALDEAAGDDAARAASILRGYAARYRTMPPPPTPHPNHPGVVTWSGLDESVWIIRLAWAHALLRTSGHHEAGQDATIRDDLLRPAAEHLHRVRWPGIHNVRVWNNAALVTLALALDDDDLLHETLHGPRGVDEQLAEGLLADGSWWEGSLSYHYYSLAAVVWTARAPRASGRPFAGDEALRRMFAAPLALALPDLTLPALHDCWYHIGLVGEVGHGIPDAAGFYETAYGWFGDPAFAWVLNQNATIRPRSAFEALLDGATAIPAVPEPTPDRHAAAAAGLAVLRAGEPAARQTYLALKASPDGGGHGHPDQLALQLFAHGARFVADPGTAGYGIALNDSWYRQSASHATVVIDGVSQPSAAARIERYDADGDPITATGSVTWEEGAYAGVEMRRTLLQRDGYCLDVAHVRCPHARQIDWVFPCLGALDDSPATEPAAGALTGPCGYEWFDDVRRQGESGETRLHWQSAGAVLEMYLPAGDGERFLATAPGNPADDVVSVLVRRRVAESALYVTVLAPVAGGKTPAVRRVDWLSGTPFALAVATATRVDRWEIPPDGSGARLGATR